MPDRVHRRFEDMPNVNINTDRLWLYPRHFHLPQLIDDLDLLQTLTDPKGPMTEAAVNAVGHKIDEVCMAAMFGTRKTGETGATDSAFTPSTSTNQVAVTIGNGGSGNVGLNVEKLL
ncbi:MAG: phage capsid protein, partial [Pseudomonadota bacterium]